jgi:hypothetical protein
MAKRHSNWRGCSDIDMIYYNDWADPDLVATIDGTEYAFNYWDIEDALWDWFLEDEGITERDTESDKDMWDKKFNEFCQYNAYEYLKELLYSGYFAEGSADWKDRY